MIDNESYLNFSTLYWHLTVKLNKLAIVSASKKKFDGNDYFRFYKMNIYKLNNPKKFIQLLKEGKIDVTLISRINKSGSKIGQYRNKNMVFEIDKQYIDELFEKTLSYDSDKVKAF